MNDQRLQVSFRDSSDDDIAHVAGLDIIHDGEAERDTDPHGGDAGPSGAGISSAGGWADMLVRGVQHFFAPTHNNEPFPVRQVDESSSSSMGNRWGYGVLGSSSSSTDNQSTDTSPSNLTQGSVYEENYEFDLLETVLQYQRTPDDLYVNIILASLKAGDLQVSGDVFRAASGTPTLIKTFLESGHVDTRDPIVQGVIQIEIDKVLSGNPYNNDIVSGAQADYLRCLCNISSSRIDLRQMVLLRYSGFEFIKILYDCPHLLNNIDNEGSCVYCFCQITAIVNFIASWIGVIVSALFAAVVVWAAVNWFKTPGYTTSGYWTILCYVGSYVVSLVATMRAEQERTRQYDVQRWGYPDNNLKIVPIIPIYELLLTYTALRYELLPDKRRYFVIRYDLRNGIVTQQLIHGIVHAIPQVIVQWYLFTEYDERGTIRTCYLLILCTAFISFFLATFVFIRMTVFSHSCDAFGFAVMCVDQRKRFLRYSQRIMPTSIITRILLFFTISMLMSGAVTNIIHLLGIDECSENAKIFISVYIAAIGLSIIILILVLVYAKFNRAFGFFCVVPLIMEISYIIYSRVGYIGDVFEDDPDRSCTLALDDHNRDWRIPHFVTFVCVCIMFLVWVGSVGYELITGRRLQQKGVDRHLE